MKIIKVLPDERFKTMAYGSNSPLIKAIKERYDYDEVMYDPNMSESEFAELIRGYDVLLTMWQNPHVPNELATNPGNLRYICNITGEMTKWIDMDIIESPHLKVTNWGNAPAFGIAEGAFSLLMSVMKDIPLHIKNTKEKGMLPPADERQTTLYKRKIGIYGLGAIGMKFLEFLRPFEPNVYVFDPYLKNIPEDVTMVDTLEELFSVSQIVVIHAGLTDATRGSVKAEHLAMLPDGGILINTARGQIVDFDALKKELFSGRLRAGLDVVTEDNMPAEDDPVRNLDNVIFTAHHIGAYPWGKIPEDLDFAEEICLRNLKHFENGEELEFVMTPDRYKLST